MIFYTSNNSFEIGKSKASSLILFWHDKELDKGNGLGLVNDIYQERAYNGDNYECFAAHAIFVFNGGHIYDGRWCCS